MKRSRSLVPANAQVPVALVLGALFLLLLYIRFGPPASEAPVAAPPVASAAASSMHAGIVEKLEALQALPPVTSPSADPPPIPRNPFFPLAEMAMAEEPAAAAALEPMAPLAEALQDEVIAPVYATLPQLSGVLTMGKWRQAILDGKYLRQGDSINGYQVVEIRADRVLLRDAEREEWVSMTTDDTGAEL